MIYLYKPFTMGVWQWLKNFTVSRDVKSEVGAYKGLARAQSFSSSGFDMSGFKLSYNSFYTAYRNNADIYGCVREWQENIGANGWELRIPTDSETPVNNMIVSEISSILNFTMPWRETKDRIIRDIGVTGNAYAYKVPNVAGNAIVGFQIIDPRTISIVCDKYGQTIKYIQKTDSGGASVTFEPWEIIHFRLGSDPNNEAVGFSPMETVIWEARTDIAAMIANYSFFENDALPSAIYVLDERLNKEQVDLAIAQIQEQLRGAKNKHKSTVMSGVKEIKTIQLSQKDMEFLSGRKFTTEKICSAYGVPKFFLGYTESVNNNNAVELRKGAFEGTFAPIESLISETLNEQFINAIGLAGRIEFKFKAQKFEQEAEIERRALEELRNGAITLRQYKLKTGQKITPEDELNPNFDRYILQQGAAAVLLEDVGISPLEDITDQQKTENLLKSLETYQSQNA